MSALLPVYPVFAEPLELSLAPARQHYPPGADIEVLVSIKRRPTEEGEPAGKVGWIPLLLFCQSPYLSFHFVGTQPDLIGPKEPHVESDFDLGMLKPNARMVQRVNLGECYQLGEGRYTLHAVYDTTQREAGCDSCTSFWKKEIWSGVVKSNIITLDIRQ